MIFFLHSFLIILLFVSPLISMESGSNNSSICQSRDSSPVSPVRVAASSELVPVMYYEYPGCREVTVVLERRSLSIPGVPARQSLISQQSTSLPEKSKLEQLTLSQPAPVLSQSTERFNIIQAQLAELKASVNLLLTGQKSLVSPENSPK